MSHSWVQDWIQCHLRGPVAVFWRVFAVAFQPFLDIGGSGRLGTYSCFPKTRDDELLLCWCLAGRRKLVGTVGCLYALLIPVQSVPNWLNTDFEPPLGCEGVGAAAERHPTVVDAVVVSVDSEVLMLVLGSFQCHRTG